MAIASSNRVKISMAEETTPNTLQPLFYDTAQVQRLTGESIADTLAYTNSEEIRSDRQLTDLVQTESSVAGDFQIEMSFGTYDHLLKSLMGNSFVGADTSFSASTAIGSTNTLTSTAAFTTIPALGQWVKVSARTDTTNDNNGFYQVSKTVACDSSTITLEGSPLLIADSATEATTIAVSGTMIMGTNETSFTIVREHTDLSPALYFTFVGMHVSSMSLSFSVGSILSGSFSFMGTESTQSTTAPLGTLGNELPASTSGVMNSVADVADIYIDNQPQSTTFFSDLGLDVDAALRAPTAIGKLGAVAVSQGRFAVTGSISAYFKDLDLFDKYNKATAFGIAVVVEVKSTGEAYVFTMGQCKFDSLAVNADSSDSDILASGSYTATMDKDTGTMLQIDKFTPV